MPRLGKLEETCVHLFLKQHVSKASKPLDQGLDFCDESNSEVRKKIAKKASLNNRWSVEVLKSLFKSVFCKVPPGESSAENVSPFGFQTAVIQNVQKIGQTPISIGQTLKASSKKVVGRVSKLVSSVKRRKRSHLHY